MGARLNAPKLAIVGALVAAVIAVCERTLQPEPGGSLLLSLSFWFALAEGCVAVMAAAEICHANWHRPIMRRMLSALNLLPFLGLLFLVLSTQMKIYPWVDQSFLSEKYLPFHWMNREFFIVRNIVMIAAVYLVGRRFGRLALKGDLTNRYWAVVYMLLFVLDLTMIGFEWIMSLEKPWFSTLLGAWVAVSGFLAGICGGALVLFGWRRSFDHGLRRAQKSIGGLMFGFSIFWAYFYFSQLLVIWYGNLPEEVSYLAKRIGYHTPYWAIARLIFGMVWFIPFWVLLGRKPKTMPAITMSMALTILVGLFFQYWLMIEPDVPVSWLLVVIETIGLGFLFATVLRSDDLLMPELQSPAPTVPGGEPAVQH